MKSKLAPWSMWKNFCTITNREFSWANKTIQILNSLNLLPANTILDVGCGTGEFSSCFKSYCEKLLALDNNDYRSVQGLEFFNIGFEDYTGPKPDLLFFKQTFHLIPNIWDHLKEYSNTNIVLLQAPKLPWASNTEEWNTTPLSPKANEEIFKQAGRETYLFEETLEFPLKSSIYQEMILGGYSSDLKKLTKKKRKEIWESLGIVHDEILYKDDLNILIAKCPSQGIQQV
jgi:hypothetical protein